MTAALGFVLSLMKAPSIDFTISEKSCSDSFWSRMVKSGERAATAALRRRMRWPIEWKVPPQNCPRGTPVRSSTRSSISLADLFVNVSSRMSQGLAPWCRSQATR